MNRTQHSAAFHREHAFLFFGRSHICHMAVMSASCAGAMVMGMRSFLRREQTSCAQSGWHSKRRWKIYLAGNGWEFSETAIEGHCHAKHFCPVRNNCLRRYRRRGGLGRGRIVGAAVVALHRALAQVGQVSRALILHVMRQRSSALHRNPIIHKVLRALPRTPPLDALTLKRPSHARLTPMSQSNLTSKLSYLAH